MSGLLNSLRTLDALWAVRKAAPALAEPATTLPGYTEILDAALDATGLRDGWEADTLTGREPLDLLHAVRLEGRRWLRELAEGLLAEVAPDDTKALFGGVKASVGSFFKKASKYTRELFAAAVLAIGGPGPLTQAMEEGIERNHEVQQEYMDKFHREIIAGTQPLDGTLVARAESYGAASWGVAQDVMIRDAVAQGVLRECRRVHVGPDKPCDPCASEQAKGWIPIKDLLPIGETPCRVNCHCHVELRQGPGRPAVMAGRHRRAA